MKKPEVTPTDAEWEEGIGLFIDSMIERGVTLDVLIRTGKKVQGEYPGPKPPWALLERLLWKRMV